MSLTAGWLLFFWAWDTTSNSLMKLAVSSLRIAVELASHPSNARSCSVLSMAGSQHVRLFFFLPPVFLMFHQLKINHVDDGRTF